MSRCPKCGCKLYRGSGHGCTFPPRSVIEKIRLLEAAVARELRAEANA